MCEEEKTPFERFRFALSDMLSLTLAHVIQIEKNTTFEKWAQDQDSIFTKSALVYLCAAWEAFIEDCAKDIAVHLVNNVNCHKNLPLHLRKIIAKELKSDNHELALWNIADDGWRQFALERIEGILKKRINQMNAPKTANVRSLFADTIGLENIDENWAWELFDSEQAGEWLDKFVEARGAIAHGRTPNLGIGAYSLEFFTAFLGELARLTHNQSRGFLLNLGVDVMWEEFSSQQEWSAFALMQNKNISLKDMLLYRPKEMAPASYAVTKDKFDETAALYGVEGNEDTEQGAAGNPLPNRVNLRR